MNKHEIRYRLALLGIKQSDIARQLGVPASTVSMVFAGTARSADVEELAAQLLGVTLHQMFPNWYAPNNRRIRRRPENAGTRLASALSALQAA
jgi:transcriptional regulator with XRE-family HTH domain